MSQVWNQHTSASTNTGSNNADNKTNSPVEAPNTANNLAANQMIFRRPGSIAASSEAALNTNNQEIKSENKPHFILPSISDLSGESSHKSINSINAAMNASNAPSKPSSALNARGSILGQQQPLRIPSVQSSYASPSIIPSFSTNDGQGTNIATNANNINSGKEEPNNGMKSQVNSTGLSVASFDNPLPPSHQQNLLPNTQYQLLPPAGQQQQQQQQVHDAYYRPLNVKDALSYLEQVKFQFNSRPDVYNHFLDIMKDFKSQAIDTPGVIERVSTLFRGYPNLIQGFNTFLPQGYRIECSANPDEPIRVTTPMGSSTVAGTTDMAKTGFQAQTHLQHVQSSSDLQEQPISAHKEHSPAGEHVQGVPAHATVPISADHHVQPQAHFQPEYQVQVQSEIAAEEHQQSTDQTKKTADVEFSQAISYVNKIKNRFADQPDIYKHFLEILQTYQREQKPINEVYAQVTVLFQNAPDLLDDFKKFLPDSSATISRQQQQSPLQQPQQAYSMGGYYGEASPPASRQNLPPLGSFSPPTNGTAPHGYFREQAQSIGLPSVTQTENLVEQTAPPPHIVAEGLSNESIPVSNMRSPISAQSPSEVVQFQQQQQLQLQQQFPAQQDVQYVDIAVRPEIDLDPSIVPVVPEPTEPIEESFSLVEETSFFDKAKKFIGNKQIYTEFLKILNLFSQDLLNIEDLVDKVEHYLGGNKELFTWFKNFVGFQDKPKHIENIVHGKHRLDLDLCEACGPSYKKLPKTDSFMPCSGRDEMCWAVLNDEWVGHPVWASEDSGFIAHRKNQYEETLFKIEEERHEYDFYIESNLRTIQTLETIASKIANMTEEEKTNFKLPPGLGHTSLTIYKKVIRKVYDKERGFEIIDALHEHPAVAVPVVLKRLKQKDEEWRRAQREWNKVWRELEQKVYFKSLDHLGLTFKQADKKLLTTKQLISEISSIKVDQTNKRMHWLTPKPKSQLDYDFPDNQVLYDILSLAEAFIHHSSNYSNPDKERLKDLLKGFISLFYGIPLQEIYDAVEKRSMSEEEMPNIESNDENDEAITKKRPRELEIPLRDILHRIKYQTLKNRTNVDESGSAPSEEGILDVEEHGDEDEEEETIRQEAKKPWLLGNLVEEVNSQGMIDNRKSFNLFANTNIYVFFRHLTTLYERLFEVKQMNKEVTKEINSRKVVQFAKDLNLISVQLREMGLDFGGTDAYEQLLFLSKRLVEGDIEHQWFEESLRQAYNNKAFKLYTVDKVVQALVKHTHTIMTDSKSSDILILYEKDRAQPNTSTKDQILYRLQTRSHMSNTENMFRIEFNRQSAHVCIQYIAVDDLTLPEPRSLEDKWKYYITSYSLSHPTEGVSQEELQIPFLEKIIEAEEGYDDDEKGTEQIFSPEGVSKSTLNIKVDPETYFLEIEPGSYDVFSRKAMNRFPIKVNNDVYKQKKQKKRNTIAAYLEGKKGWKKNLHDHDLLNIEEKFAFVKKNGSLKGFVCETGLLEPSMDDMNKLDKQSDMINGTSSSLSKDPAEAEDRGNDTTTEEVDTETATHHS